MKRIDIMVLASLLAIALIWQGVLFARRKPAVALVVSASGENLTTAFLDQDGTFAQNGALGPFEVAWSGGAAHMVSSTCPDELCVKQGAIRMAGQSIVCIPNQVSILLEGDAPGGVDAVTR